MGQPAAKQGDKIVALDRHTTPTAPPQIVSLPFIGALSAGLSPDVSIQGAPAATEGSIAFIVPPHVAAPNQGKVDVGSRTVLINGKGAARNGDPATTCSEPPPFVPGKVVAAGTVLIGD